MHVGKLLLVSVMFMMLNNINKFYHSWDQLIASTIPKEAKPLMVESSGRASKFSLSNRKTTC